MATGGYKNMAQLLQTPAEKLLATYENFSVVDPLFAEVDYMPTCDGKFLPEHPYFAFKDGAARGIKLLTGTTEDEYLYWAMYFEGILEDLQNYHAKITPILYEGEFFTVRELYATWEKNHTEYDGLERYLEFANQLDWRVGQELVAEYQSAFDDVYFYLFNQKSPVEGLGSCHAIDLPFVFGNPSEGIEPNPSPELIKKFQAAWTSFAATGNPDNDLIPTWKKYSADDRQTMEINSAAWSCRKDLNVANLAELRGVYEKFLLN